MIHIIEGEGKGKTTSSVGFSVRAAGHGLKVLFMQFLKDDTSGEIAVLQSIPEITVVHAPVHYGFTFQMTEEQKEETAREYDKMLDQAINSDAFLVVLDEVIHAVNVGLIEQTKLEKLLCKRAEIVLTGRETPEWLLNRADYISTIKNGKHPFDQGIQARQGVEY